MFIESQYLLKLQSGKITKTSRLVTAKRPREMSCCQSLEASIISMRSVGATAPWEPWDASTDTHTHRQRYVCDNMLSDVEARG